MTMIEQLFGSKTRVKVLQTLFHDPEKVWFVRELTRSVGTQINAIRRELELLLDIGLVKEVEEDEKSTSKVKKRFYTVNTESSFYEDLASLLVKGKMYEQEAFVQELCSKGGKVSLLMLTGAFTGAETATDMLIVGELKERNIDRIITAYEKEIGFPIRYTLMKNKEYVERRQMMDKFIISLLEEKHVKAVNSLGI